MGVVFGKVSVETPEHVVVHKTESYQIWRYPQAVAATVHASNLQLPDNAAETEFTSAAFRALARYIGVFGNPQNRIAENETGGENIAMTAPVEMKTGERIGMTAPVEMRTGHDNTTERDIKNMQMSFYLPSKYRTVSEAPIPTNEAVKLLMIPGRYDAVMQYSGNLFQSSSAQKAEVLLQQIRNDGFEVVGEWSYCGYNPPYTLPWLKRNEVHIPINGTQFDHVEQSIE